MESFVKSDIFFFISSVGFTILTILLSILLVYIILIAHRVLEISIIVKKKAHELGKVATDISVIALDKAQEVGDAVTDAKDFIAQGGVIHWIQYLIGSSAKKKRKGSEEKDTFTKDN